MKFEEQTIGMAGVWSGIGGATAVPKSVTATGRLTAVERTPAMELPPMRTHDPERLFDMMPQFSPVVAR